MKYLFAPPAVASVPILGSDEHFPIRRIFCVGRNYEAHAREFGIEVDRETPFYFTKAAAHYVPSGATVCYPPGTANYHHWWWRSARPASGFQRTSRWHMFTATRAGWT